MSFESVRGSCRFGSMQGIFQREGCHFFLRDLEGIFQSGKASLRKKEMKERIAAAADFYLDQGTVAASRDHHKRERLCERNGARRFENREAAI